MEDFQVAAEGGNTDEIVSNSARFRALSMKRNNERKCEVLEESVELYMPMAGHALVIGYCELRYG
jgi:hypothetical protein